MLIKEYNEIGSILNVFKLKQTALQKMNINVQNEIFKYILEYIVYIAKS